MELILRSLQEDGVTPVNGDYTVIYYVSGVLTTVTDTGVSSITVSNVDDNSAVNVSVNNGIEGSFISSPLLV